MPTITEAKAYIPADFAARGLVSLQTIYSIRPIIGQIKHSKPIPQLGTSFGFEPAPDPPP